MRAVVIDGLGEISVREVPFPAPGPNEVTIKVEACGLCGTDAHIYHGEFLSSYPIIPGHEFAGTVAEVGDAVTDWEAGARVAVDPSVFCHDCFFCKSDRGNHCLRWNGVGVTRAGGLAEYVAVPGANLYRIDESLTFEQGAFIEPISCVVYGLRRLKPQAGDQALVFGAGPIGLLHTQLLARGGTSAVTVVDLEEDRLEQALKLGARHTVRAGPEQDATLKRLAPLGFDLVVDATGVPQVVESTFRYVMPTGKIMFFGVCPKEATIQVSPFDVYQRDLEIYGSFALRYTFYYARDLLTNGAVQVEPLISHRVGLEDAAAAIADPGRFPGRMKMMVHPVD
ncbi:MAG: zinc-dependent alcohol dehydrogenase family protein [Anaerolineae bacterium]|nr:zinc-dependent alcohol dehydrogenase family protein [Anaerolineae bacterium]